MNFKCEGDFFSPGPIRPQSNSVEIQILSCYGGWCWELHIFPNNQSVLAYLWACMTGCDIWMWHNVNVEQEKQMKRNFNLKLIITFVTVLQISCFSSQDQTFTAVKQKADQFWWFSIIFFFLKIWLQKNKTKKKEKKKKRKQYLADTHPMPPCRAVCPSLEAAVPEWCLFQVSVPRSLV